MERYIIRATLENGTELYLAEHNVLLWTLDVDNEHILFCTKRQVNKYKNEITSDDRFYSSFAGKAIKNIDIIKVNDYIVYTHIVQQA